MSEDEQAKEAAQGAWYRDKPLEEMTRVELIEALLAMGTLYTRTLERNIEERNNRLRRHAA